MAQTPLFVQTLKACLKDHGLTYADVAQKLDLSEASVKRIFSEKNISLHRIDQICEMMNMELCDLAKVAEQNLNQIQSLNEEQEAELVKQPKLLLMAYLLLNEIPFETIKAHYQINDREGIQLLAHLDRIRFIDLLPGNRVKLLTSRNFRWRKNGAIEKLFNQKIQQEFFKSRFNQKDESMKFASAMVSKTTITTVQNKIDKLIGEFNELAQQDNQLPFDDRIGVSLVAAIRSWEFSMFESLKR